MGIDNRAIIRRGIGGNRVLREYKHRIKKHWGVAGIKRFEHTLDTSVGADAVIVLHGINDIIHPGVANPICPMSELPTAEELIEGYRTYIEIAHRLGFKIYFGTLLPCPRCLNDGGYREELRCAANEWIRTSGEHDGIIDFETAVQDENDPKGIAREYDSGDHLHPSLAGARKMAHTVPVEYFVDPKA
jgi:lysophospholipase L1-like esterase